MSLIRTHVTIVGKPPPRKWQRIPMALGLIISLTMFVLGKTGGLTEGQAVLGGQLGGTLLFLGIFWGVARAIAYETGRRQRTSPLARSAQDLARGRRP